MPTAASLVPQTEAVLLREGMPSKSTSSSSASSSSSISLKLQNVYHDLLFELQHAVETNAKIRCNSDFDNGTKFNFNYSQELFKIRQWIEELESCDRSVSNWAYTLAKVIHDSEDEADINNKNKTIESFELQFRKLGKTLAIGSKRAEDQILISQKIEDYILKKLEWLFKKRREMRKVVRGGLREQGRNGKDIMEKVKKGKLKGKKELDKESGGKDLIDKDTRFNGKGALIDSDHVNTVGTVTRKTECKSRSETSSSTKSMKTVMKSMKMVKKNNQMKKKK